MDKRYDLAGIIGTGATKKAAQEYALKQVEHALHDMIQPYVQHFPCGTVGLVFRAPQGWWYQLIDGDDNRQCGTVACNGSRASVIDAMRRHVAQNRIFIDADHGWSCITNEQDRAYHVQYVRWQLWYRQAAEQGRDDTAARAYANTQGDGLVTLYTTAPEAYDGMETVDMGPAGYDLFGTPLREVDVRVEHEEWQTGRYARGMHATYPLYPKRTREE